MGNDKHDRARSADFLGPDFIYKAAQRMERDRRRGLPVPDDFVMFVGRDGPVLGEATPENLDACRAALLERFGEAAAKGFDAVRSMASEDPGSDDASDGDFTFSFQLLSDD